MFEKVSFPSGVAYYQKDKPFESSKEIVLLLSYQENAYSKDYDLPNISPRWWQDMHPLDFKDQVGALENERGSNLNKFYSMFEVMPSI